MLSAPETQKIGTQTIHGRLNIDDPKPNVNLKTTFSRDQDGKTILKCKTSNDNYTSLKSATQVLQSFNTWAFKREQPDTPELLLAQLAAATTAGRPIRFLLYWGKGPRHEIAEPERACLDFLASMTRRVGACYPAGAEFMLIFTDTHAELNGHSRADIDTYFAAVADAAAERGFMSCRMSRLLSDYDPRNLLVFNGELRSDPIFEKLMKCASKWYFGDDCLEGGAELYYRSNLQEKRVVELAFPESIFVTFNGHDFRSLFPDTLPIFFMYSVKRGCSVKPWFLPGGSMTPASHGQARA